MSGTLPDLSPFFARYEALAGEADAIFAHIRNQYPAEVACREGCSSCCYALFDLSLVEALYLNAQFNARIPVGTERFKITENASAIDRKIVKIKRQAFRDSQKGKDNNEILREMAVQRVRCPLLDAADRCMLYDTRPITCRLYGVPTAIGGKAHTCGQTGFLQGVAYPTVALDKMQERLADLSRELAAYLQTAYTELHFMYVPVSMALITTYDAAYLGIGGIRKEED